MSLVVSYGFVSTLNRYIEVFNRPDVFEVPYTRVSITQRLLSWKNTPELRDNSHALDAMLEIFLGKPPLVGNLSEGDIVVCTRSVFARPTAKALLPEDWAGLITRIEFEGEMIVAVKFPRPFLWPFQQAQRLA